MAENNGGDTKSIRFQKMNEAIQLACDRRLGVIDHNFLCASITVLGAHKPVCVSESESTKSVLNLFDQQGIGSVLVTGERGKVTGIFTERDCVRRVIPTYPACADNPIKDYMTPNPVMQPPDITIAFALNLMSHGGFRHIPIIDESGFPLGLISVRDVVDYLANSLVEDLLSFDTSYHD